MHAAEAPRPQLDKALLRRLIDAEHWTRAEALADRLIEAAPEDAELHYLRSTARVRQGRPLDALADLERSVRLDPERIERCLALVTLRLRLGRYAEALETWLRLRSARPDDPQVRRYARWSDPERGRLRQALDALEQRRTAADNDPELTARLAALHYACALWRWRALPDTERLQPVATSAAQLEHAEKHLAALRRLSGMPARGHRLRLENLIAANRRRRYDGGLIDLVLTAALFAGGLVSGGPLGLWYAGSAVASLYAWRRPAWLDHCQRLGLYRLPGGFANLLDWAYGAHLDERHPLFAPLDKPLHRMLAAQALRGAIRGVALPLAVAGGWRQNHGPRGAAVAAAACAGFALFAGL